MLRFKRRWKGWGKHEAGKPEAGRRIAGIRRVIRPVVAIPRSPSPSPRIRSWSGPWVIGPAVVRRLIIVGRVIAVVGTSAIVITLVDATPVFPVIVVCARIIGTAAASYIGPLYVATPATCSHNARSIARAHDGSSAVHPVLNLHAVPVDGADLSIGTNVRRPPAFHRNLFSRWRVVHCRLVSARRPTVGAAWFSRSRVPGATIVPSAGFARICRPSTTCRTGARTPIIRGRVP